MDNRGSLRARVYYSDGSTPGGDSVYVIDTETGDVLQTLVAPEPFGTELSASYVIASSERIVVSSIGQVFVFDPEGNRYLASSEECDDGNTVDGDGCSAKGRLERCPPAPRTGCHAATARQAHLTVRAGERRHTLAWRMQSAESASFGDPTTTTSYRLCVYDGSGAAQPGRGLTLHAGGLCGGTPCWSARGTGFTYRDPDQTADGIGAASLRHIAAGVLLRVRARGTNLVPPALPLGLPLQVQLLDVDGSECWTSTFSDARANTTGRFSARGD